MGERDSRDNLSSRTFLGKSSAMLAAAAVLPMAVTAQPSVDKSGDNHWLHHTPKEVLAKNFNTREETFKNVLTCELFLIEVFPDCEVSGYFSGRVDGAYAVAPRG